MADLEGRSQIRKYGVLPMVSLDRGTELNVRFLGPDQKANGPDTSQASGHIAFRLLSRLAGATSTGQALQRVADNLPQVLTTLQQAGRSKSGRNLKTWEAPINIQDAFNSCYSQPEYSIRKAGYRIPGRPNEVESVELCYPFPIPSLESMQTVYQLFKKLSRQAWEEKCCRKALMTLGGHTLLVIWQNGSFLFVDTLSHGGFKPKDNAPANQAVHGAEDAYCAVAEDWPAVQSYLRYVCDERRGWREAGLPVEDMKLKGKGVKSWDTYRIEMMYFSNKKEKRSWDWEEGGVEKLPTDAHPAKSGDPFSLEEPELDLDLGQGRSVLTAPKLGGKPTIASRYATVKFSARKRGEETTPEFRRVVEKLDVSIQEGQRAFDAELRRVEQRTMVAQKKKAAELAQEAEAKGRQTEGNLRREQVAQERERVLDLERDVGASKTLTGEVYRFEQVRAELVQTRGQLEELKGQLEKANQRGVLAAQAEKGRYGASGALSGERYPNKSTCLELCA